MKGAKFLLLLASLLIILIGCSEETAEVDIEDYPEDTLNVIIPFGSGGGTDLYMRKIMDIIEDEDLYDGDIKIENKEGGSGATGWGYMASQKGDPYFVGPTSGSFFTTPIVSDTNFQYDSFTPIALMGADDLFFLVDADSDYEDIDDFVDKAKAGKTMKLGGDGAVSDEMIVNTQFGEEANFDYDYVPFQDAGELTSALLSGSLDAIVGNPQRSLGNIEGGEMRALAYSGEDNFEGLPDVPTFKESGYDVNMSQPRGIILPDDVDPEVEEWWIDTMKEVSETDEWKEFVETNGMSDRTLFGDDFEEFLEETSDKFEKGLEEADVDESKAE
ncbi:MAG TPA: tripartite tricarboxylate transporter substrate-binding protein [Pseudogracilibacillus sp.]|nr:tripartite tricarboxylate transporter substrate-binding protein [Pseudogracilibacillus sp.]